jgi:hypothetical protein
MKKLLLLLLCVPLIGVGQVCNSAYFDGIDDGVILEHPMVSGQSFALSVGREFTVELWIKTSSIDGTVFQKGGHIQSNGNPGYVNILLDQNGFIVANYGHPTQSTNITFGGQGPELYSINALNDNNWHHIAFLRDSISSSNYNVELYVDGILNDNAQDTWDHPYVAVSQPTSWTNPASNQAAFATFTPFTIGHGYIGSSSTSVFPHFNGYLDNVRFYNRNLSSNEILNNMNSCMPEINGLEFSFNFDSILSGEYADYTSLYSGNILDISVDLDNPICCDCQISNQDTTVCNGTDVVISSMSTLNYLWYNGDTTSSLLVNVIDDSTITLFFLDLSGNLVCSDSIYINIFPTTTPTIQQVGNNLLSSNGQSYQWYLNGVLLSNETSQTINILGSGTYNIEITDLNGCSALSEDFIVELTHLDNDNYTDYELIGMYDMYGRKINQNKFHSVMFLYFSDGTVEKKIIIE